MSARSSQHESQPHFNLGCTSFVVDSHVEPLGVGEKWGRFEPTAPSDALVERGVSELMAVVEAKDAVTP